MRQVKNTDATTAGDDNVDQKAPDYNELHEHVRAQELDEIIWAKIDHDAWRPFIVQHQIIEVLVRQANAAIDEASEIMRDLDDLVRSARRMSEARTALWLASSNIRAMPVAISKEEFLSLRPLLGTASGAQSRGFSGLRRRLAGSRLVRRLAAVANLGADASRVEIIRTLDRGTTHQQELCHQLLALDHAVEGFFIDHAEVAETYLDVHEPGTSTVEGVAGMRRRISRTWVRA